ncbi:MAG: hypothetical protein Q7S36_01710 [Candidatus Liptonbacteria bacterium]|nr:hypothetical protein [Candidatus Liptonbacteria bacterium]
MKRALIVIGVMLVLGAGAYFIFFYGKNPETNPAYKIFKDRIEALGRLEEKGKKALRDLGDAVASGGGKLGAAKNFLDKATETVSSTIAGIEKSIPPGAVEWLAKTKALDGQKAGGLIFTNGGTTASSPGNSFQGDICIRFPRSSEIKYEIDNPFSPPKDYSYSIDWGDGKTGSGKSPAGGKILSVAHAYDRAGSYLSLFSITSASSTLGASVKVCIR